MVLNSGDKSATQVHWAEDIEQIQGPGVEIDGTGIKEPIEMVQSHDVNLENELIPEIEWEDIQEEVNFWESALVCYVLGANSPLQVTEGFPRRIWGKKRELIELLQLGMDFSLLGS